MTLEQQVVSLELSKRMKELGFKQDSLFYQVRIRDGEWRIEGKDDVVGNFVHPEVETYSAYTVAELGEMLLGGCKSGKVANYKQYYCRSEQSGKVFYENTEADARAKMLIYLKENNLI